MLVKMTVKQIREIKPHMYFILTPEDISREEEFDFVFSGDKAYKIHRLSGQTSVLCEGFSLGFDKEIIEVEGLQEDTEVLVEPYLLQAWLRKGDK